MEMPVAVNRIQKLSKMVVSQIAAGEVIENPASVLKELVENSIDARANDIEIFIYQNGFQHIQVKDNGIGIPKEDLPLSIESFATSKLNKIEDLISIGSLGFRGEALGAISSVANITIESKEINSEYAYSISKGSGLISDINVSSLTKGSNIIVSELFHDLPARKEFLCNTSKIKKSIIDTASSFALGYPDISFRLHYDDKLLLNIKRVKNLSERIEQLFSSEFLNSLLPCYHKTDAISVEGYISSLRLFRSSSDLILLFINSRSVRYAKLINILRRSYGEMLPANKFPVAFLFLNIPPEKIDVNVHPQKKEIRFKNESEINSLFSKAVLNVLESHGSLRSKNLPQSTIQKNKKYPIDFSAPLQIRESLGQNMEIKFGTTNTVSSPPPNEEYFQKQKAENIKLFSEFKLHGRLYNTFIMASAEEGIYLFDQHTVHERVNYEKFLNKLKKSEDIKQYFVTPVPVQLSPSEILLVKDHQEVINQLGFFTEEIGPDCFGLSSAPFYLKSGQEEQAFRLLLKKLETQDYTVSSGLLEHEILFKDLAASLACRQAIKKGELESLNHLKELIEELQKCKNPMRCPHGRPTMVFIGEEEILRLFKRFH